MQRQRPSSSSSKKLFCCFLSDTLLHLCFVSAEDSTFCESYGIVACTHTLCVVHSAAKSAKIQPFQLCKYHVRSCHKWRTISPLLFHQISVDPMFSSKIWTSDASVYHTNHPGNSGSSDQRLQQCTTQLRHTITIFIDFSCSAFWWFLCPQDFCDAQTMCQAQLFEWLEDWETRWAVFPRTLSRWARVELVTFDDGFFLGTTETNGRGDSEARKVHHFGRPKKAPWWILWHSKVWTLKLKALGSWESTYKRHLKQIYYQFQ